MLTGKRLLEQLVFLLKKFSLLCEGLLFSYVSNCKSTYILIYEKFSVIIFKFAHFSLLKSYNKYLQYTYFLILIKIQIFT